MMLRPIVKRGQEGMCTVEYAYGTVVACGFACVLFRLSTAWRAMFTSILLKGLEVHVPWDLWPR